MIDLKILKNQKIRKLLKLIQMFFKKKKIKQYQEK